MNTTTKTIIKGIASNGTTRKFLAFIFIGFAGLLLFVALPDGEHNAHAANKEQQVKELRLQQAEAEADLIQLQAAYEMADKDRLEAQRVLDEKLATVRNLEAQGQEIRTLINEAEKQIVSIRDGVPTVIADDEEQPVPLETGFTME